MVLGVEDEAVADEPPKPNPDEVCPPKAPNPVAGFNTFPKESVEPNEVVVLGTGVAVEPNTDVEPVAGVVEPNTDVEPAAGVVELNADVVLEAGVVAEPKAPNIPVVPVGFGFSDSIALLGPPRDRLPKALSVGVSVDIISSAEALDVDTAMGEARAGLDGGGARELLPKVAV